MITVCLSSLPSASATGRATVSATPPGGNGTTIVIVRSGYCARAAMQQTQRKQRYCSEPARLARIE